MEYNNKSQQVFLYKPGKASKQNQFGDSTVGGYAFPAPAPLVSISSQVISERSRSSHPQGTADAEVARKDTITLSGYFINTGIEPGEAQASYIFSQIAALQAAVQEKDQTLEINTGDGALVESFEKVNLVSIDIPEGKFVSYGQYTVTFECFNTDNMDNDHIEFSWDFSVSEDESMGYFNSGHTEIISSSVVSGTETITATALNVDDARGFVDSKVQFDGGTVYLHSKGKVYDVLNSAEAWTVCNLVANSSVDVTAGSVTYTSTFILVPQGQSASTTAMGSFGMSKNSSYDQPRDRGVLTGTIMGLSAGGKLSEEILAGNAYSAFQSLKDTAVSKIQEVGITITVTDPLTENITKNYGAGNVEFTLEYDNREPYQVADVVYERIDVTNRPSRRVHAVIPVMGRPSGPILQDTYAKTEKQRDFTIEVVYEAGKGDADGPGTQAIEDDYKPSGNIVFESAASTSWQSAERRFIRQKSWVYEG